MLLGLQSQTRDFVPPSLFYQIKESSSFLQVTLHSFHRLHDTRKLKLTFTSLFLLVNFNCFTCLAELSIWPYIVVPAKRLCWSVVFTSHQQMPPLQSIYWVLQVCSPQFFRFALQQSAVSKQLHWSIHLSCLLCRLGAYWQCNRCALLIPWKCHCNLMMMCMDRKSVCMCVYVCVWERENLKQACTNLRLKWFSMLYSFSLSCPLCL